MKKSLLVLGTLVLFLVMGLGLTSCGQEGPEDVAIKFIEAVSNLDIEKAGEYTTEEGKQLLSFLELMSSQMSDEEKAEMQNAEFTVVSSEINGDTASVVISAEGEENAFPMIKVDGEWKVDLNKESLNKEM